MQKALFCLFYLLLSYYSFAQTSDTLGVWQYWLSFTDKADYPFSVADPPVFLSQRSIERREKQGIANFAKAYELLSGNRSANEQVQSLGFGSINGNQLRIETIEATEIQLSIFNIGGQLIQEQKIDLKSRELHFIPLQNYNSLKAGLYFFQLKNDLDAVQTIKWLKK